VIVGYADAEPNGLAAIVGELIGQNLRRDPARRRLLRPAIAAIDVPDAGVAVTIRLRVDAVRLANGVDPAAHVRIRGGSDDVLRLTRAPLRFGVPDPFRAEGRAAIADLLHGRVRVRGLLRHPVRTARLCALLSVA
jgi:hypothetical protein